MGGIVSSIYGWIAGGQSKVDILPESLGPEADIPDPVSSLTPREAAYLKSTWALARPDIKIHGMKFFILLFTTYPHIQLKFTPFAGKPIDELIYSPRLKAHGTTFMMAIDGYISNIDDLTMVIEMLKTTGLNHKNRDIKKEDFEIAYPVLLQYLGEALGPAWTEGAQYAWTHLTQVIHSVISPGFD